MQPWYLDAVTYYKGDWDVALSISDNKIRGILPYFTSTKYGISHITMPLLTPYLGPWLFYPEEDQKNTTLYSYEKKVLNELIVQLPNPALTKIHTHPNLKNVLSILWKGYSAETRYTYMLNQASEQKLWANLDSKQRNIIQNKKGLFHIEETDNADFFYSLNKKSFTRTGNSIPYNMAYFIKLDEALKAHDSRKIYIAKDANDQVHASIYTIQDPTSTYCLAIGNDPDYKNSGALPILMWHTILESLSTSGVFNFEGGMIPNIEQFFRSFGGTLTPYYCLKKARNKFSQSIFHLLGKY